MNKHLCSPDREPMKEQGCPSGLALRTSEFNSLTSRDIGVPLNSHTTEESPHSMGYELPTASQMESLLHLLTFHILETPESSQDCVAGAQFGGGFKKEWLEPQARV